MNSVRQSCKTCFSRHQMIYGWLGYPLPFYLVTSSFSKSHGSSPVDPQPLSVGKQLWFCRECILWQLLGFGCYLFKKPMSPLWQTPISNYIHFSNITFFGFIYGLKVVAKSIAEHTSIFQTPFVQSRALSITYLLPCQRNPGVIMPKNQVHPITPQGPGLLGNCPCRTPGPLAFGAAGHRWGPQGEQNADKAAPVWQQHRRRWCPGASELRESRKKTGGEGDGAVLR